MEEEAQNQNTKKTHHILNPTDLNQRHKKKKEALTQKQQKTIIALTRRTETKGNKMKEEAPNEKTKKKHNSFIPTDLNPKQ